MFSFSGKKDETKIIDRIFLSQQGKLNAIAEEIKKESATLVICWFDDTYKIVEEALANQINAEMKPAREVSWHNVESKKIIFSEHYPLIVKEQELFEKLKLTTAIFYTALDDALLQHFGGDKIIAMMKNLGMNENEPLEHPMISSSIRNAQDKIASKVAFESPSRSQKDWFQNNLK